MSEYLTAVQERKLVAKFRQHVIALPPGSRVEWREMDAWAKSNFPVSVWVIIDNAMIPIEDYEQRDDVPWSDLCIECMVVCEKLELEGYLAFQKPGPYPGAQEHHPRGWPDYYYRTDKTELEPWE
jgi:hypothetical protein